MIFIRFKVYYYGMAEAGRGVSVLFLELHGEFSQGAYDPHGERFADGNTKSVPPVGNNRATASPQCPKTGTGATVGRDQYAQAQANSLPMGSQSVQIGGHAGRRNGCDANALFADLFGEGYGEAPQIGFRGAV